MAGKKKVDEFNEMMEEKASLPSASISPGEMYREITISESPFEEAQGGAKKAVQPKFVNFCKWFYSAMPSLGKGASYRQEYREAIEFLDWELKPEEFDAGIKGTFLISFLASLAAFLPLWLFFGKAIDGYGTTLGIPFLSMIVSLFPPVAISILAIYYVQSYPLSAVRREQVKALTYVPEIIGYMIMSMKLVPNLEKAVEFAAQHGKQKIADDFKRLIWDVQLGVYNTLSEGLDALAYRWGKNSEEFKLALMRIRASVIENSEAKRYQLLDQTMENVLASIREKMENYARSLSQPSIVLFYLGVMLPLILIIILPIGSAFTGQAMARTEILILVYNVIIPVAAFLFARNMILQRPPSYEPPYVPDNHPLIPKKGRMRFGGGSASIIAIVLIIAVAGIGSSVFVHFKGIGIPSGMAEGIYKAMGQTYIAVPGESYLYLIPPDRTKENILIAEGLRENNFEVPGGKLYQDLISAGSTAKAAKSQAELEEQQYFMLAGHETTPHVLLFGLLLTFSICFFIYLYFNSIYKRKVQEKYIKMESEFKDSLYILASRMAENKPVEEALKHTRDFLPDMEVSQTLFAKTIENIELLGMPLETAVFDPTYGSLKNNPSSVIRGSMKLLVDSVQLGGQVAARTLMSLSVQLTNSEKVTKMLSVLVSDITSMMTSMATFIAPIVLGITVSLQKIVMGTLSSVAGSGIEQQAQNLGTAATGISGLNMTSIGSSLKITPESFAALVDPAQFLIIVGLYVIEIVIVLTYFTTKIEEDNNIKMRLNIATAVPIAIIVFIASVILSGFVVGAGGFLG